MAAGEVDLVIVLRDMILVQEDQLGDDSAPLERARAVEIRDVADDQTVAVERDRIAALDQLGEVRMMTEQSRNE